MKKRNIVNFILLFITIFSFVMILFYINKLNIIPLRYCYIFSFLEFFLLLFAIIFNKFESAIINYISIFITVVVLIINCCGFYYVRHFDKFLDKGFTGDIVRSNTYYLVTSKNNDINIIEDVSTDSTVYYYNLGNSKEEAFEKTGNYNYVLLEDLNSFFVDSLDKDNYLLIEKNNYNIIFNQISEYNIDDYKIIYQFDIKTSIKRNEEVKEVYNVLLIGKDFSNLNDFNMLVTVNTKTRKVLLTSISRDYYIPAYGYNFSDTVSLMAFLGEDVPRKSIGAYFGVEIDYIVDMYTDNIVDVVDKIGGIEYCSNQAFTTFHAKVMTYDDRTGKKLYIKKGCQHLNGIETLTVARERKAFARADRQRQENCRQIMLSILRKIVSGSTLLNYTSVLDSFNGLYETDMNRTVVTTLLRDIISNGEYEIESQLADGYNTMGIREHNRYRGYVTYPDEELTKRIKAKIKEVMEEK